MMNADIMSSSVELLVNTTSIIGMKTSNNSDSLNSTGYNFSSYSSNTEPTAAVYEDAPYPDFSQIACVRILFVCLFLLEFVVCVVGNTLVILTVYRTKAMHSPVNYYIVNLGICDFLVGAFVLPTKLFELTADAELNMLNDAWCTVVRYLETIVVFTSVFTLVAICVERYYAVVYPVHSRVYLTYSRIGRILFAVWIIPCIVAAPNVYPASATAHHLYSDFGEFSRTTCFDRFSDDFRRSYFIFLFFCMYIIPLLFIGTTCYGIFKVLMQPCIAQPHRDPRAAAIEKGRRKVAKMVLVVVFAFVICWSPYFFVTVVTQLQTDNFMAHGQFFFTMLCINLLGFANSCVNPIVYFAMSTRFRKGYTNILRLMFCCSKTKHDPSPRGSLSSVRRTSHRVTRTTNGSMLNHPRHNSSPSHDLNDSTGSTKVRPVSAVIPCQRRSSSRKSKRSHTIVLNIQAYSKPCPAQLIPLHALNPLENGRPLNQIHYQYEDYSLAQESLIV